MRRVFTGLVQKTGRLASLVPGPGGSAAARVECAPWPGDPLVAGESVAVQGCCLTVTSSWDGGFEADVLAETLAVSALGALPQGAAVNLERALRPGDRLGGHIVQGHVDGTAVVEARLREARDWRLRLRCAPELSRYVVYKGSVALDGTSLTVSAVPAPGLFEVCLIPTTWAATTLSLRREGDRVNVETDVLGRYVEAFLSRGAGAAPPPFPAPAPAPAPAPVTEDLLRRAGFTTTK